MNEQDARTVAKVLGGKAEHHGGNIWLVRFDRKDGSFVLLSGDCAYAYRNEEQFHGGENEGYVDFFS